MFRTSVYQNVVVLISCWTINAIASSDQHLKIKCYDLLKSGEASAHSLPRQSQWILGKQNLSPTSEDFLVRRNAIMSVSSINEFPVIPAPTILNLEKLEFEKDWIGLGTQAVYVGILEGRKICIKIPNRDGETTLNEVKNLAVLNKVGLGAELLGLVHLGASMGLVTEYIPGVHFPNFNGETDWSSTHVSYATLLEMKNQILLAGQAGFPYMTDVQFRIRPDGSPTIVDTEGFFTSIDLPWVQKFLARFAGTPAMSPERAAEATARRFAVETNLP